MSSDIFFILTVIYVTYVIYSVVNDEDSAELSAKPVTNIAEVKIQSKVAIQPKKQEKSANIQPDVVVTEKKPEIKKSAPVKTTKPKVKKLATPKVELRTVMMKNPATGEEAKVASNYRMVKRWIKEALVEEGLLEKIYKNTELDDAAKITVAEALSIIKAMDKYKV